MEARECPQCGAPANLSDRKCPYCKAEHYVTNLKSLSNLSPSCIGNYLKHYKDLLRQNPADTESLLSLGLCYLQIGSYTSARECLEGVIKLSPELSQAYYYDALSMIAGRRIMILPLKEVKTIEKSINDAIMLNDQIPQYHVLLAMIKRDYYEANGMKFSIPSASSILMSLEGKQLNRDEVERLFAAVKVSNPDYYTNRLAIA